MGHILDYNKVIETKHTFDLKGWLYYDLHVSTCTEGNF